MTDQVNYITHHRNVYFKMSEDNRLSPYHLSIYNALFMLWNECGFAKELSINRNDVMLLSKIGNANTYTKCLKELNKYGYIIYNPSFNPLIGSKITIIRFDKGSDKGSVKGGVKGGTKGTDKGGDTLYKQLNKETTKQRNKETIIVVTDQKTNFKKWNLEDFQNSIKTENETNLERSDLIDFYDYWIEPTPSGMFRFQTHKTWSTKLRLKTWSRNKREINPKPKNQEDGLKSAVFGALTKLNGLN